MCLQEAIPIAATAAATYFGGPQMGMAVAATMAGNYMQTKSNNESQQAQYDARATQMVEGQKHQDEFAAQNANSLTPAIKASAPSSVDLGAAITNRQNKINDAAVPSTGESMSNISNAPKVVQNDLASRLADSAAFSKQQGDSLGFLGGVNDAALTGHLATDESSRKIGSTNSIARTDMSANNAKANAAYNNAKKGPDMLGEGLSTIGTVAGLDAMAGGPGMNSIMNMFSSKGPNVLNPTALNAFFAPPT